MLVLGSLLILSTIAVEFAYNAHVAYDLASAERDRLKAYYLARSALNLARLELRVEKQFRSRFASILKDLKGSGVTADPLCKQIPLSTGLLKGLAPITGTEEGEATAGEGEATAEEGEKKEEAKEDLSEEAKEFLSFEGDFEVACDTEERKININAFREAIRPGAPVEGTTPIMGEVISLSEEHKNLLKALLSQKEFEPLFKGKPDEIRKVVNAIADWSDRNDQIDEAGGISGGYEESEYSGPEYHYKVKNGKYVTVPEVLLVAGVGDDLYAKLASQLTVYGDNKINLCQASDEMVKAFVFRISQTPGATPISPDDDEKLSAVLEGVRMPCGESSPSATAIAQAITGAVGGDVSKVAKLITTTNRFYRIEATGLSDESRVKLVTVVDTGPPNPNLWKTLYFRVE